MKTYNVLAAAYIRGYTRFDIEAKTDEAAIKKAIQHLKKGGIEYCEDIDHYNIAMPAIAHIYEEGERIDPVIEGLDVAVTAEDARDFASAEMLEMLQLIERVSPAKPGDGSSSVEDHEVIELEITGKNLKDLRALIAKASA